jgi:hypothetical protein
MKTTLKKESRHTTEDGYAYLTKRTLVAKAKSAGRLAAKNAMEIMGYVVTVKDGWVVEQHEDGHIVKLSEI